MRPRAIFFGTPPFAVPSLDALVSFADVSLVVTQPDRPAGRGLTNTAPAVKLRALELGLPVIQPTKVRTDDFADTIRHERADVAVVVAYGRILPRAILEGPRAGCVNVHASLLPRWRGAAPIQWAIASGDAETGVCLMKLDEGMDTGPVIARRAIPIASDITGGEMTVLLSALGGRALGEELPAYLAGDTVPTPQPEEGVTHARPLEKSDAEIDFTDTAARTHDRIRAMTPAPGAFARFGEKIVKLHVSRVVANGGSRGAPGTIVDTTDALLVACGTGVVALDELQLEGKKRMAARDLVAGARWRAGDRFDTKRG